MLNKFAERQRFYIFAPLCAEARKVSKPVRMEIDGMKSTDYIHDMSQQETSNMVAESAEAFTANMPKTQVPLGNIWMVLHELTASDKHIVAMQLLKEAVLDDQREATPFVLSIGKKVDLSDVFDEKDAYRQHLKAKYA